MFDNVIGQDSVKQYLSKAIESDKLPGSLLFHGPSGTGKTAAALDLAKTLTCLSEEQAPCLDCASCRKFKKLDHPDVMLLFPKPGNTKPEEELLQLRKIADNPYEKAEFEKKSSLQIEMVRAIKRRLRLQSFQGHGRVVIIQGCEQLNNETSNALLKILEEPPSDATLILTTSQPDKLLLTIKSRCQLLHFSYLHTNEIAQALVSRESLDEKKALSIAYLSGGNYTKALGFLNEKFEVRKDICGKIIDTNMNEPLEESVLLAEKIIQERNQQEISADLEFLITIFRILYESKESTDSDNIGIPEVFDIPQELIEKCDKTLVEEVVEELEKSIDLMSKNVYLFAILLILFFKLRKVFRNE